jgi:hypothetical protein
MHPTDDLVSADLLDAKATADAVAGSSVAYLVAGVKYDARVWQEQWPACQARAILPDRVYEAVCVGVSSLK